MPVIYGLLLSLVLLPAATLADTKNDEINYLINSVGRGGCTFIHNDERYSGKEARAHLRSKRKRNAHLIHSAEDFIKKIASRSSTSGESYMIGCRDEEQQTANEWFTRLLALHRSI